jgi:GcrA cell cycle regulator
MDKEGCNMRWTDERVATLKKLWIEGLSAAQIAQSLGGVTRNAVIGKVHRLGLQGRATPSRPAKRPVRPMQRPRLVSATGGASLPRTPRPPTAPVLALAPALEPMKREDGSVNTVLTLNDAVCRWPIGDPQDRDFAFCGRGVCQGAYCADHARLAFQPPQNKKKKPAAGGYGEHDELRRMMRLGSM